MSSKSVHSGSNREEKENCILFFEMQNKDLRKAKNMD